MELSKEIQNAFSSSITPRLWFERDYESRFARILQKRLDAKIGGLKVLRRPDTRFGGGGREFLDPAARKFWQDQAQKAFNRAYLYEQLTPKSGANARNPVPDLAIVEVGNTVENCLCLFEIKGPAQPIWQAASDIGKLQAIRRRLWASCRPQCYVVAYSVEEARASVTEDLQSMVRGTKIIELS